METKETETKGGNSQKTVTKRHKREMSRRNRKSKQTKQRNR